MTKKQIKCDDSFVHEDIVAKVESEILSDMKIVKMASFFKIFGDVTRMKILCVLDIHEMCVCDIANLLNMTISAVSHQLAVLRKANIVSRRKSGKTVFYSLSDEHIHELMKTEMEHLSEGVN